MHLGTMLCILCNKENVNVGMNTTSIQFLCNCPALLENYPTSLKKLHIYHYNRFAKDSHVGSENVMLFSTKEHANSWHLHK